VDIRWGFPNWGHQATVGWSKTAFSSAFSCYFFGTFTDKAIIITS